MSVHWSRFSLSEKHRNELATIFFADQSTKLGHVLFMSSHVDNGLSSEAVGSSLSSMRHKRHIGRGHKLVEPNAFDILSLFGVDV